MGQTSTSKVISKVLVAMAILSVLLAGFSLRNNTPPKIVIPPPPPLPSPNARDYFIKACDLMKDSDLVGQSVAGKINGYLIPLSSREIDKLLNKNNPALKILREGMKFQYQEPATRSMNTLYPHYAKFRNMAKLLSIVAKSKQLHLDWRGAMNSSLDSIEMGNKVPNGGSLIGGLVGVSIQTIGRKSLESTIPHLDAISAKIGGTRFLDICDKPIPTTDIMLEEKYTWQNELMYLFYGNHKDAGSSFSLKSFMETTNGGTQVKKINPSDIKEILKFLWVGRAQTIADYSIYMDALIAQSKLPYAAQSIALRAPDDRFTKILTLVYRRSREKFVENEAANAVLTLNMAIQGYKMDHERYPDKLEQLVPYYLKHLPADPRMLSGSFDYRREKIGYTLLSKSLK